MDDIRKHAVRSQCEMILDRMIENEMNIEFPKSWDKAIKMRKDQ